MKRSNFKYICNYNPEYDILGILIDKCNDCYSVEKDFNGLDIYIMKEMKTNRIVGIEIMGYSKADKLLLKNMLPKKFHNIDFNSISCS